MQGSLSIQGTSLIPRQRIPHYLKKPEISKT